MVENGKKHRQNSHPIIHFPTSEGVSEVSERVSVAEGASEASSPEQASKGATEGTDKRVAQYFSLYSWLFWPTVKRRTRMKKEQGFTGWGPKVH